MNYMSDEPVTDKYHIHMNGAVPYIVKLNENDKELTVFSQVRQQTNYVFCVRASNYEKLFIGGEKDYLCMNKTCYGNTFLVKLSDRKNRYLAITGDSVSTFDTDDEIIDYQSPIKRSDVSLPYTCGTKYTYLLGLGGDCVYFPKEETTGDPYTYYFNGIKAGSVNSFKKIIFNEIFHEYQY